MFFTKGKMAISAYFPHEQIKILKLESKIFAERQTYAIRQSGNQATLPYQWWYQLPKVAIWNAFHCLACCTADQTVEMPLQYLLCTVLKGGAKGVVLHEMGTSVS